MWLSLAILAFTAIISAAPLSPILPPKFPVRGGGGRSDGLDIDLTDTIVGETVDALPVDISVSAPIIPSKRSSISKLAVRHDGGSSSSSSSNDGLNVDLTDTIVGETVDALPVDLSVSAPIIPSKRSSISKLAVRHGGGSSSDGLNVDLTDTIVGETVDALPVDISVSAPIIPTKRAAYPALSALSGAA
jgi:hypothetical protein